MSSIITHQITEGVSEFSEAPIAAPVTSPIAPAPQTPPVAAPHMVSAETVEKARLEERAKLRKEIEASHAAAAEAKKESDAAKAQVEAARKQAEADARKGMEPNDRVSAELKDLKDQLAARDAEYRAALQKQEDIRVQAQLSEYRNQRLRELTAAGVVYVEGLVAHGPTVAEIDMSLVAAANEGAKMRDAFMRTYAPMVQPQPQPTVAAPQPAPQQQYVAPQIQPQMQLVHYQMPDGRIYAVQQPVTPVHPGMPQGAIVQQQGPAPTAPAPVPSNASAHVGLNQLPALTTEDAVRSGQYGANREKVFAVMKQGQAPAGQQQMPMRAFPGEQVMPAQQPFVQPYQMQAPQPQQQYVAQPGGVMVPIGLPGGQPLNPQQMAFATQQAVSPQQHQQVVDSTQYQIQQQADLRQQAMDAVQRALGNPDATVAAALGGVVGGGNGTIAGNPTQGTDYAQQASLPAAMTPAQLQSVMNGQNPMARNSG